MWPSFDKIPCGENHNETHNCWFHFIPLVLRAFNCHELRNLAKLSNNKYNDCTLEKCIENWNNKTLFCCFCRYAKLKAYRFVYILSARQFHFIVQVFLLFSLVILFHLVANTIFTFEDCVNYRHWVTVTRTKCDLLLPLSFSSSRCYNEFLKKKKTFLYVPK